MITSILGTWNVWWLQLSRKFVEQAQAIWICFLRYSDLKSREIFATSLPLGKCIYTFNGACSKNNFIRSYCPWQTTTTSADLTFNVVNSRVNLPKMVLILNHSSLPKSLPILAYRRLLFLKKCNYQRGTSFFNKRSNYAETKVMNSLEFQKNRKLSWLKLLLVVFPFFFFRYFFVKYHWANGPWKKQFELDFPY